MWTMCVRYICGGASGAAAVILLLKYTFVAARALGQYGPLRLEGEGGAPRTTVRAPPHPLSRVSASKLRTTHARARANRLASILLRVVVLNVLPKLALVDRVPDRIHKVVVSDACGQDEQVGMSVAHAVRGEGMHARAAPRKRRAPRVQQIKKGAKKMMREIKGEAHRRSSP